jgi:hypothetical protein
MSNPNQFITPGLFVKVRLPIGDPHPAIMVRERSLQSDQGLKKVFVLQPRDEKGVAYELDAKDASGKPIKVQAYRPIAVDVGTLGVLRDRFREVNKGIKEGDLVVAQGMQKIRLGNDPITKKPLLVKARPWSPEDDLGGPSVPKTAGVSASTPAGAGAAVSEKSLPGDVSVPAAKSSAKSASADNKAAASKPLAGTAGPAGTSPRSDSGSRR